jgi:hypothetical protein
VILTDKVDEKTGKIVADFTDYESSEAVCADGCQYTQGYKYFDDKKISVDGFIYKDWESDEV